jgi:LPXTG-motif cell wall-anchored protein
VHGGDVIKVRLRWDESHFDGPTLHKALDCVTVDGDLAPDLSVEERDTANDGEFEHSYTVPKGLPEGTRVCDRGFISGPGRDKDKFYRKKSNVVCFPVAGPTAGESGPSPAPPPSAPTPPPPVEQPPAPPPIGAGPAGGPVPPRLSAETPLPAAGQAVQPGPQPAATLPRTGSDSHLLVLVAAGALLSGALSAAARGPRPASRLSRN